MILLRNYFIISAAGAVCRVAVVKKSPRNKESIREKKSADSVLLSLLMYSNVMLQPLYIGVGRFRILGVQGLEYWGGARGAKFPAGT